MSGIGPVESVDSTDMDGSYEVIGGDSPASRTVGTPPPSARAARHSR